MRRSIIIASVKPLTANFAAEYDVWAVIGPTLAQNPFTELVLTMCASSLATNIGMNAGATIEHAVPADAKGALPFLTVDVDHAATTSNARVVK